MLNIGPAEFLVIAVVALVVLGPEKLPEAARKAGRLVTELRRMSNGFQAEVRQALDVDEPLRQVRQTVEEVKADLRGTLSGDPVPPPAAAPAAALSEQAFPDATPYAAPLAPPAPPPVSTPPPAPPGAPAPPSPGGA